jgi:hypothetical protein
MSEIDRKSVAAIMCETGYDESFLVGTEEELRALAHSILNELSKPRKSREFFGVEVTEINVKFTETMGDVCIVGIEVTKCRDDTKKLINAIRINNGEQPIAGEGWPYERS